MGLQLTTAIARARPMLNDTDAMGYRYSDVDLLAYANDALDEILLLAPFYFHVDGDMPCIAGQCLQRLSYNNASSIVDVTGIKNGGAVTLVDRAILDRFQPGWLQDPAAPAVNWIPVTGDPMSFYIYPRAPANQTLRVIYVSPPAEFTDAADTGLPLSLIPAIMDYIIYRAESRDDEHVNSQRAVQFAATFAARFTTPGGA